MVDLPRLAVGDQFLEGVAVQILAAEAVIVVVLFKCDPAKSLAGLYERLASRALGFNRAELLAVAAVRHRLAGVDGDADGLG